MAVILVYISIMSNFMAVIIVVTCLLAMIGYIYRLRGDFQFSSTSITMVNQPRIQQDMIQVKIPFSFELVSCHESDGIVCKITNSMPCLVQIFWCVSITDLHMAFSLPWRMLRQKMLDANEQFLSDASFVTETPRRFRNSSESHVTIRKPSGFDPSCLGPVPRTKYPIAVVMVRDDEHFENVSSVAALLTVIHIEDSVCKIKTCILFQYLKQANGYISHLKPLFVSGSEESYEAFNEPRSACTCIVCQMKPVSMALLPCRHTCICNDCFTKLDKCPLCRSAIVSYFCLQNNSS